MQLPTTLLGLIYFVVALVVVAIVAVFLFQNILLPIIDRVT